MAVTRINNNQVTTAETGNAAAGINAAVKIQDYSINSQKLANDIVIGNSLTVTGNLYSANISSDFYQWANGAPIDFGILNYSNANVASFLPTYSGNLSANNITGNAFFWGNGVPIVFGNTITGVVIGDQQFYGDSVTTQYALTSPSTNTSVLVSINGITQYPGVNYASVGNTIAFAVPPLNTDFVDLRFFGDGSLYAYNNNSVISLLSSGTLTNDIVTSGNITANNVSANLVTGVPVLTNFASLTALDAAIPTPLAGMMAYDTGNNTAVCWNGSSWNNLF